MDFLGERPQLLEDLAAKGALRQGDITCCSPTGRRIWSPLCTEDSRVAVVTDPPQGPLTLRCGQFWPMYTDMDGGGMVRGAEVLHEIREVHTDGNIRTRRWSLAGGSPYDPTVGTSSPTPAYPWSIWQATPCKRLTCSLLLSPTFIESSSSWAWLLPSGCQGPSSVAARKLPLLGLAFNLSQCLKGPLWAGIYTRE